jgi:hypothetical protein
MNLKTFTLTALAVAVGFGSIELFKSKLSADALEKANRDYCIGIVDSQIDNLRNYHTAPDRRMDIPEVVKLGKIMEEENRVLNIEFKKKCTKYSEEAKNKVAAYMASRNK